MFKKTHITFFCVLLQIPPPKNTQVFVSNLSVSLFGLLASRSMCSRSFEEDSNQHKGNL